MRWAPQVRCDMCKVTIVTAAMAPERIYYISLDHFLPWFPVPLHGCIFFSEPDKLVLRCAINGEYSAWILCQRSTGVTRIWK